MQHGHLAASRNGPRSERRALQPRAPRRLVAEHLQARVVGRDAAQHGLQEVRGTPPHRDGPLPVAVLPGDAAVLGAHQPLAVDAQAVDGDPYLDEVWPVSRLDDLLAASDVVSLHCPRSPTTERLIRAETLARMPRGSYLVNTAGGACVDASDLLRALDDGHLAGAALDVFGTEPLPSDDPLLHRDDVLLTPHLAGAAQDVVRHHTAMICDDLEALHAGRAPRYCANPEVLP